MSCLLAGALTLSLAGPGFTLEWTHSVERVAWREEIEVALARLDPQQREAFLLKHGLLSSTQIFVSLLKRSVQLRLMGSELRLQDARSRDVAVHHNRPSDPQGYAVFRRVMAHLSSIQDRHALNVEPLFFQRAWTVPAASVTPSRRAHHASAAFVAG